ncbi:MAG: NUDIX domain-containing protein [bacterium]|nr:NUDIX domain-containing protein [bacterium]
MKSVEKLFVAIKAFIVYDGKILLLREGNTYEEGSNVGKWSEPGGRIKPGESYRDGLLREIKEETGLMVEIGEPFAVGEWWPLVKDEQWQIVATFLECTTNSTQVVLSKDHDKYQWFTPEEILTLTPITPETVEAVKKYIAWKQ